MIGSRLARRTIVGTVAVGLAASLLSALPADASRCGPPGPRSGLPRSTARQGDDLGQGGGQGEVRRRDDPAEAASHPDRQLDRNRRGRCRWDEAVAGPRHRRGNVSTFLPYVLQAIGDNIEVWVQEDTSFPAGDCRNAAGSDDGDSSTGRGVGGRVRRQHSSEGVCRVPPRPGGDGSKTPLDVPEGYFTGDEIPPSPW